MVVLSSLLPSLNLLKNLCSNPLPNGYGSVSDSGILSRDRQGVVARVFQQAQVGLRFSGAGAH